MPKAVKNSTESKSTVNSSNETVQPYIDEIKELKRKITAFENEHFMFQGLLDTIPDLIYFKDRKSRFIRLSKAMDLRFKHRNKIEEVLGKTDFDMYSGEHAQQAYDDEQQIIKSGESIINQEEKETWEDGSVTWASTTKVPLYDKDKNIIGIVGISRDITERKENEAKLKQYRENLELAKQETDNILANVDEGLFLLDINKNLSSQYSAELESILAEKQLAGRNLMDILNDKLSEEEIESAESYLDLVLDDSHDTEMLKELNPLIKIQMYIKGQEKYLTFKFKRILNNEKNLTHLITTVTDVTNEVILTKYLEESRAESKRKMDWMVSILNVDPVMLKDFIKSAEDELNFAENGFNDLKENPAQKKHIDLLYRSIHTIKGNASLLDLDFFADIAHEAENDLQFLRENKIDNKLLNDFHSNFLKVKKTFEDLKGLINQISGIHEQFRPRRNHEHKMLIHSLEKLANRLSKTADKKVNLNFDKFDASKIPFQDRLLIRDILVQLVRNAIVHGIETAKDRIKKGKSDSGNIWITADADKNTFKMSLKDDGNGLDLESLKTKAVETKKWSETDLNKMDGHQIGELMFEPGISTVKTIDMGAGRGVGMDIIKKKIAEAGGSIEFESKKDLFTLFLIEIPLNEKEN
ncbi:MAG: PAS domain-containing protein [Calditrichaceae bacterium]